MRFVLTIFLSLLLCQNVSVSQTKNDTSDKPNTSTLVAKEQQSTDEKPEPNKEQANVTNEHIIRNESKPLVDGVAEIAKIAKKVNLALFFTFLASLFAGLSWWVARGGANITRKATKAEYQPYISFPDQIEDFHILFLGNMDRQSEINIRKIVINLSNTGKTPAKNVCCMCDCEIMGDLFLDGKRELFTFGPEVEIAPLSLMERPRYFSFDFGMHPKMADTTQLMKATDVFNASIEINVRVSFEDEFTDGAFRVFEAKFIKKYIRRSGNGSRLAKLVACGETEPTNKDKEARKKAFKHRSTLDCKAV